MPTRLLPALLAAVCTLAVLDVAPHAPALTRAWGQSPRAAAVVHGRLAGPSRAMARRGSLDTHALVQAGNQAGSPLTITLRHVDVVPLDATGDITHEELFIFVDAHYSGAAVLRLSPANFALIGADGVPQDTLPYAGPGQLQATNLVQLPHNPPAHTGGWLLYKLAKDAATDLSLVYMQTTQLAQGASQTTIVARVPVPIGAPSARRVYATLAQPAFQAYVIDEAQAAGDIFLNVDPLYANEGAGPVPGAVVGRVQHQLTLLRQDRHAFDAIPARGAEARALRTDVDQACAAVEKDLADLSAVHTRAQWLVWRAAFDSDNTALDGIYQIWPAAE